MARIITREKQNGFIKKSVENNDDTPFRIAVLQRQTVLETGEVYLLIEVHPPDGKTTTHWLLRSDVLGSQPKRLIDLGVDVPSSREGRRAFEAYIREQEQRSTSVYTHTGLGWPSGTEKVSIPPGNRYFKGYQAIGLESQYSGFFDVKPHGTFDGWKSVVDEEVMPYLELQLSLVLGMTAVVLGYLYPEVMESLLVHLYGLSSTGKTTALFTAMSCACKPDRRKSLMTQWSSTFNALYGLANGNFGYPIVIDELSGNNKYDLSEFVYNLVNGAGKDRMTSSLELREKESWGTVFISSGETSLLSKCNKNAGLNVRVIEMNLPRITRSAEHAEALNRGFREHYGHANLKLAKHLLQQDYSTVLEQYDEQRRLMVEAFGEIDSFTERIVKKLAVIVLTAVLAEEVLELKFDIKGLRNLLVASNVEQTAENPRDLCKNVLQAITAHLAGNPRQYSHSQQGEHSSSQSTTYMVGMVNHLSKETMVGNERCYVEILYLPEPFAKILHSAGIPDAKLALESLRKHGYLSADAGKFTRKRSINGAKPRVHVILLPESYYSPQDEEFIEL